MRIVEQSHSARAPQSFGHRATENIDLIVVGQRDHRIRFAYVCFFENILIKRTALQNDCIIKVVSDLDSPIPIKFNNLRPGAFRRSSIAKPHNARCYHHLR